MILYFLTAILKENGFSIPKHCEKGAVLLFVLDVVVIMCVLARLAII